MRRNVRKLNRESTNTVPNPALMKGALAADDAFARKKVRTEGDGASRELLVFAPGRHTHACSPPQVCILVLAFLSVEWQHRQ